MKLLGCTRLLKARDETQNSRRKGKGLVFRCVAANPDTLRRSDSPRRVTFLMGSFRVEYCVNFGLFHGLS